MAEDLGTLRGRIVLDVKQALGAYRQVRQQHQNMIFASRQVGDSFVQSGRSMVRGGALMVGGFALAVKAAAEFERKMDFFQAVTNTSEKEMKSLNAAVLKMAQDSIFSGDQVANGIVELGKAGVSAKQIIEGVGDAMISLGAAGDIPLEQAGQIITSTIQQFDLAATDATKVADKLAGAANASIVEIDDLGVSLKYVGGVAAAAGLSFEDVNDALALLGKAGIRGSTAGTSLRQMIVSLGGATKPAQKALREIGIITGKNSNLFYDQTGRLKPLSSVFQILQDKLSGYNQKQKLAYLRTIFNNRALSAAAILTRGGAKGFEEMNKQIGKTTAADVAHKRLDNLSGDIEILRGNIETFMIKAGTPFQDFLRDIVQAITATVQAFGSLPDGVQTGILSFFAISGVILILVGIFNIIIGSIFNFIYNIGRLAGAGEAVGAVFKGIGRALLFLLKPFQLIARFAGMFLVAIGPIGWVILAIIALGVAIFIAYKKSEKFRAIVDSVVKTLKGWGEAVVTAVKPMVEWLGRLLPSGEQVGKVFNAIAGYINHLKGLSFTGWIREIIKVFIQLNTLIPRMLLKLFPIVLSLAGKLGMFLLKGFLNMLPGLAMFIARFTGSLLGFLIALPFKILAFAVKIQVAFLSWMLGLVPKIAGLLGFAIGFIIGFIIRLHIMILQWAFKLASAFISWLISLPGKAASLWVKINQAIFRGLAALISWVISNAPRIASGFVNAISNLPGLAWGIIRKIPGQFAKGVSLAYNAAGKLGRSALDGFTAWISEIPDAMSGIISSAIGLIKKAIGSAFNSMKEFGGKMWKGFKKGIGIASPSYVEKAMFALTKNTQAETKKLARTTLDVQRLSKKMAATAFGPNMDMAGFADVAKLQKSMAGNTTSFAKALGLDNNSLAVAIKNNKANGPAKLVPVEGEMTVSEDGKVGFKGWAKEVYDDEAEFDDSIRRM